MFFFVASCLSYGHSCWGAHGKRSGPPLVKSDDSDPESVPSNRWELIKMLQNKVIEVYFLEFLLCV